MTRLRDFLRSEGISQAAVANGIGKSETYVSKLVLAERHPSQETIDALLAFLCSELGRKVTYEDIFTPPSECK